MSKRVNPQGGDFGEGGEENSNQRREERGAAFHKLNIRHDAAITIKGRWNA